MSGTMLERCLEHFGQFRKKKHFWSHWVLKVSIRMHFAPTNHPNEASQRMAAKRSFPKMAFNVFLSSNVEHETKRWFFSRSSRRLTKCPLRPNVANLAPRRMPILFLGKF
jgi:hypothetical protein